MMTKIVFGRDHATFHQKSKGRDPAEFVSRGLLAGTPDQIVSQLEAYSSAGLQRIMLQWLDLDDMDGLAELARIVLPHA